MSFLMDLLVDPPHSQHGFRDKFSVIVCYSWHPFDRCLPIRYRELFKAVGPRIARVGVPLVTFLDASLTY